ncbi:peptide deformylase [Gottschalkiaceae bacterium SANA]|nr:peptide deformylase [Gottschalkiaceae bacterium SANA]
MAKREILILGNEKLYEISRPLSIVAREEMEGVAEDLEDTLETFRLEKGFGRAIAAPQIGASVRMIFMKLDEVKKVFINPCMEVLDEETFELWDDCMSFPGLEVKVLRYRSICVTYRDLDWKIQSEVFEGDLSELFQHEFDHLNGVLAVQRAVDMQAFRMKSAE